MGLHAQTSKTGQVFKWFMVGVLGVSFGPVTEAQIFLPTPVPRETDEPPAKPENENNNSQNSKSSDPAIKLPALPAKNDKNSGRGSTATPGRPNGATMRPIGKSAFPGMSCPLVDNRPYKDLVKAIDNLARVVVVTPECQNNLELNQMTEEIRKMAQAGTHLMSAWGAPELAIQDNQSIALFQSSIQEMITGINRVTGTIQSSSFMDSRCGKSMTSGTGLLMGVSDLVATFAPFALVGAAMNPSLKLALPYILGITGVGSAAKIIKSISDTNTLNMSIPEHREAVLENICEYSKISQRVRFLKMAQSGQVDLITSEIQSMSDMSYGILRQEFGTRVFDIKQIHMDYRAALERLTQQVSEANAQHQEIVQDLKGASGELLCLVTKELVEYGTEDQYPLSIVNLYKRLLTRQQRALVYQSTLVSAEQRTQDRLKVLSMGDPACAETATTYLQVIERMIINGRQTVSALKKSLNDQLNQDEDYRSFAAKEKLMMEEVEFLAKIRNLLTQLNLDNALIDKLEMDSRMFELKQALFGQPWGLPMAAGASPAMAWVDFALEQHRRAGQQFKFEHNLLERDVLAATRAGRSDFVKRDEKGNVVRDKFGYPVRISYAEQDKLIFDSIEAAKSFATLTPAIAPEGSENHVLLCRRLESIWLSWSSYVDHLAATQFFCDYISPHFDYRAEARLVSTCQGSRDIHGKVLRHSTIGRILLDIQKGKEKEKAANISNKMTELNCPKPTIEDMR